MRYVIGRVAIRPGLRNSFIEKSAAYVAASRADTGCIYFHVAPMPDDPDGVVFIECWDTLANHRAHSASAYAVGFRPVAESLMLRGDVQEMTVDAAEQVSFDLSAQT